MSSSEFPRQLITTSDGSHTLFIPELNEHYHSIHGAIQESMHVFIRHGLHSFPEGKPLAILEIGFGTGLNAFLTLDEAAKRNQDILYTTIEKYPISEQEIAQLNYAHSLSSPQDSLFRQMHALPWETYAAVSPHFKIKKVHTELLHFTTDETFDLVYFDAFAPDIQPKLWTQKVFEQLYARVNAGGVLVTYAAKGQVRRNMQGAGFKVLRVPGPPGKREMLKAIRG